ncbi:UNVERIFIED_CONTAM: hypothetical protein FKN15_043160 [Acipenser sinensis]
MLLSAFLMVVGTGVRSIPLTDLSVKKWLIHGGQLLNGLAGPTVMSAPPLLSTTWFAPDQRATATAVAALLSYLGAACSFLIGPLVVPAPNQTAVLHCSADKSSAHIRDCVQIVLYAEFAMVFLLFAAVVAYFPSRPPLPPSVAAASQRLSYRSSFCRLLRFADSMRGMLKLILLLMFSGATLSSTWLTLTCLPDSGSHLPLTTATLYTSCILVGIFIISSVPMFFELFIETVYPVPEGITCGVVTFLSNLFMGALLFFLTFYHTATLYTSCILVGIFIISSVPMFFELFIETVYPVPEGITCGVVTFLSNLFMGALLFFLTFYHTAQATWESFVRGRDIQRVFIPPASCSPGHVGKLCERQRHSASLHPPRLPAAQATWESFVRGRDIQRVFIPPASCSPGHVGKLCERQRHSASLRSVVPCSSDLLNLQMAAHYKHTQ